MDAPFATSGDTKSSDRFPGQTDVGLYYTVSGTQGPGAITGAAASATKQQQTTPATASAVSSPGAASGILAGSVSAGGYGGNATAPTSMSSTGAMARPASITHASTGAAPTDGTGSGLAMAVAGAALMMAF
ncbi:Uncharacterized protein TPAR_00769 [Tolypocladium paradoxum]|uniref:Uncharacterized protein n=1 Tax=Tolypocladium paradoxum TaxID=94208 RepID=A0A2S4L9A7_9HYPO|nr:Uncharacterized protein TPAR_00769 [Tolypocladium paradoxum]